MPWEEMEDVQGEEVEDVDEREVGGDAGWRIRGWPEADVYSAMMRWKRCERNKASPIG